jgi:fructose-specific phosphotransferase system IIC component
VQNFEGSLSFENLKKNKMLVISIISTILLQIFLVYFLPSYFKITTLGLEDWLTICGFGAILLAVGLIISKNIKKLY